MIKLYRRLISLPAWLLVVLAALLVRLALAPLPGYDVRDYRLWTEVVARGEITAIYHASIYIPYNYPPVFLYMLEALGHFYSLLSPSFDTSSPLFGVVLKSTAILADVAASLAIYLFLRRRVTPNSALLGALAFALNPAVIWNTAYWGGVDGINTLLAFLAFILLVRGLPEVSWLLLALSLLIKPLSLPIVIIATFLTLHRFGFKRSALCAIVVAGVTVVSIVPFLIAGTAGEMWTAIQANVGNYNNVSANAHNFWWLVSGGKNWTRDTDVFLGVASYRVIGFALFAILTILCLCSLRRKSQEAHVFFVCSMLSFAFFMLPTEVHENWMFGVFPFLVVASALDPRFRPILIALSITFWLNMALHDLAFGYELPKGSLGSFLTAARMANAVANNFILVYATILLLDTHRLTALAKRLSLFRKGGPDAPG
ncbi:MAG: hypothetical protein Q7O66_20740 [Dehalococcoidia bacterium]|nr:hypothetical protein [Dehalococcoidia bacterium]